MYIAIAFVLGILACALIMYIGSLKDTINRQNLHIQDLEHQLTELLAERTDKDTVH